MCWYDATNDVGTRRRSSERVGRAQNGLALFGLILGLEILSLGSVRSQSLRFYLKRTVIAIFIHNFLIRIYYFMFMKRVMSKILSIFVTFLKRTAIAILLYDLLINKVHSKVLRKRAIS